MPSRHLVLSAGTSNKFWNITRDGTSHTVNYGRVGTDGQTKTKQFDDAAACQKSYEQLIEQKLKKGYSDAGKSTSPSTRTAKKAVKKTAKKAVKKTLPKTATKKATKPVKKAAPETAPETAAVEPELAVTREIALEPADWFVAAFRKTAPLQRGKPAEADLDAAADQLAALKRINYGWDLPFEDLSLPAIMAPEEAHFWLLAMTDYSHRFASQAEVRKYATKIRNSKITGKLFWQQATRHVKQSNRGVSPLVMAPLFSLFSAEQCFELALTPVKDDERNHRSASEVTVMLNQGFQAHVLPYLKRTEITKLQKRVRQTFDPAAEPADEYSAYPAEHYAAAVLGMHKEVYAITSSWPDDQFRGDDVWLAHYLYPQEILFGLGSAELFESEWRRLGLKCSGPRHARNFLACTESAALDLLANQVCAQSNKDECAALLKVLCLVHAPEAAESVLRCRLDSKMPALARDWLEKYVGNAVAGLIPIAGKKGKLADAAIDYLRSVKRNGYEGVIAKSLKQAGKSAPGVTQVQRDVLDHIEKTYTPFDAKTTPKWLKDALATVDLKRAPKLPSWAAPDGMPPLAVSERRLNDEQVQVVLEVLATTPVSEQHPLLVAIKQHVDKPSRDDFAWQLFQFWQEDGSVAKNKWAMGAIGHLGDDGCVMKLTPMVRVWPGESQHARAVFGLECLRGVGSSTALMQLSGIAQKLKFKGLKNKAAAFVEEIAKEKGMTRAELEDRVIPDCGLDEMGRREFSFGPRSFSFVLGGDLKPMVRDEAGKIRPNMPKPGVKDDEKLAGEAMAEWKLIKKQIKDVAVLQAGRLEQAMVTGRRWTVADFEALLVRHPLMTHLVQKLIWASFDAKGKRLALFRVTEERDYANAKDDSMSLGKAKQIGVIHPLDMTEAERATWGEVLSDYEIITPFPQLGRDVYALEKGEAKTKELKRFHGLKLAAPTMIFTLEKFGWTRGEAMDGGCFDEHSKQFPAADVTAVIHYDGVVGMGYIDPDETLTTKSIHFCKGMRAPSGYGWGSKKTMKLGDVPPIVISEVMADLHVLKTKAK
ncbi:WGR and DUF4132 domain-containing protein [Roseimaritima ulvae]|uniref:WGR domain protein n=1 Tax=Roseimaritima ulvae TaxID=980254 RepID=A0A5B9QQT4_9BACT|nr:WGR and DUF4132 domain-containing protein [Roseimaritima ulvae]QEG41467.1 WGR domain protein [Roseimaritima ulvae]